MRTLQADSGGSFGRLREVAATFERLSTGGSIGPRDQRKAVRAVEALGATVVPLLCRKLAAGNDDEASWAYYLASFSERERAVGELHLLMEAGRLSDHKKALIMALLSELGAELPVSVALDDPASLREQSVRDLLGSLREPADVAQAASLLMEQVALEELPGFLREMSEVAGSPLAPLIDEILLRDRMPERAAGALRALRAELGAQAPIGSLLPPTRRSAWVGERPDGCAALLVVRHGRRRRVFPPDPTTPRTRALVIEIAADGVIAGAAYEDGSVPAHPEERLAARGFPMAPCTLAEASQIAGVTARATVARGLPLPEEFFLGRDLCGLYDEHLRAPARARVARKTRRRQPDTATLFRRASDLVAAGEARLAMPLLEELAELLPEDAEVRSCLGAALLELGDRTRALIHFAGAVRLEPEAAVRYWNLGSAAKRADKPGACYLALHQYLRLADDDEGAADRQRIARQFVRVFERLARREHPDTTVENVARGEELFERAYQHMTEARLIDAVSGFEAVLKLVPTHYPSLGNMGAALLGLGRREEGIRALQRALELKPDYEPAQKNLQALES